MAKLGDVEVAKPVEGTLSHGTLRTQDLIPVFTQELRRLGGTPPRMPPNPSDAWYDSDSAQFALEELFDRLNDVAADHDMHFGAHEGDGADFGFWKNDEE